MKIWTKCSEVLYALLNANCIRNELQNSSYQIPWPPKTEDLDVQTFPEFPLLQEFLVRLIYNEPSPKSERVKQLSLLFTQDLFFAVHNEKKLTPKSVLLPLQIKSLTNNTELITTVSALGHEISSYTKLSEITTKVAYSTINKFCQEWYFYQNSFRNINSQWL